MCGGQVNDFAFRGCRYEGYSTFCNVFTEKAASYVQSAIGMALMGSRVFECCNYSLKTQEKAAAISMAILEEGLQML